MERPRPSARAHGGGVRQNCWSEVTTEALIEAWGDRCLQLDCGNLRQKDWKEISDAFNGRVDDGGGGGGGGAKAYKTDVQCKNRIDTLKKKYKLEKSKPSPSSWRFFPRLDFLIGAANEKKPAAAAARPGPARPTQGRPRAVICLWRARSVTKMMMVVVMAWRGKHRMEAVKLSDGSVYRKLARAILNFGEIYERFESSKQKMMMDLERQRMELAKGLEFQRLNMFTDAQLELEKMKRPKYALGSGKNSQSELFSC